MRQTILLVPGDTVTVYTVDGAVLRCLQLDKGLLVTSLDEDDEQPDEGEQG